MAMESNWLRRGPETDPAKSPAMCGARSSTLAVYLFLRPSSRRAVRAFCPREAPSRRGALIVEESSTSSCPTRHSPGLCEVTVEPVSRVARRDVLTGELADLERAS